MMQVLIPSVIAERDVTIRQLTSAYNLSRGFIRWKRRESAGDIRERPPTIAVIMKQCDSLTGKNKNLKSINHFGIISFNE